MGMFEQTDILNVSDQLEALTNTGPLAKIVLATVSKKAALATYRQRVSHVVETAQVGEFESTVTAWCQVTISAQLFYFIAFRVRGLSIHFAKLCF